MTPAPRAVAVIPARGGSKRIPRKNIRFFCGKPMIAHSIAVALASGLFESIIVSTDDEEIADVARKWGAETPFLRPPELADDYTGTTAVIAHAVRWLESGGKLAEAVCCLYATAPFVSDGDLRRGYELLIGRAGGFVFSATEFPAPVYRAFVENQDGGVEMLFPNQFETRSQDLPVVLHDAAQFYWGRPSAWTEGKPIFDMNSSVVRIPRSRVQDIDTEDDWARAELMWTAMVARGA